MVALDAVEVAAGPVIAGGTMSGYRARYGPASAANIAYVTPLIFDAINGTATPFRISSISSPSGAYMGRSAVRPVAPVPTVISNSSWLPFHVMFANLDPFRP